MIKIITLIPTAVAFLFIASCNGVDTQTNGSANPDIGVSGEQGTAADPLKQLQDEGKLPSVGTGPKMTPPDGTSVDSLSMYPPAVDPDQDNVPNSAIEGHPEIPIDNCPTVYNPGQEDSDQDGVGDACQ